MADFPTSLVDFQRCFPDEAACAAWLFEARWPTGFPLRAKDDPITGGGGRSSQSKMLVAGAVEVADGAPGRIRLAKIEDFSAASLHGFVAANLAQGATIKTDGWAAYPGAPNVSHDPHVVGKMAAHIVLPWIHRRLLQLEDLGARRLTWPAKETSPKLSRRIRLPIQPPSHASRRLPLATLHRPYNQTHHLRNVDPTGICGISLSTQPALPRVIRRVLHQARHPLQNLLRRS